MHTDADHLHQSRHNRSFSDFVTHSEPQFGDWAVTGLFYSALHQVERYAFAKLSKHNHGHKEREQFVSRFLRPIFSAYRDLYDMSLDARYFCYAPSPADLAKAVQFADHIEQHVDQLLV